MSYLLIIISAILTPEIAMDQLRLHGDTQLTLFKTVNGYLLNSRLENKAILFSPEGEILARYEQQGSGPNEFNNQYVLKVDDQGIYFCSNGRFVICFDLNLKLAPKTMADLPIGSNFNSLYGLSLDEKSILVSQGGRSHLFVELQTVSGEWKIMDQHYPTETHNLWAGRNYLDKGRRPLVHHGTLFSSRVAVRVAEQEYEIEIYEDFANTLQTVSGVLIAELDGFPGFMGIKAIIYGAVKTPAGFIVELFSHRKSNGSFKRWHDHFNSEGQFIKRVAMDGARIIPVMNSEEVFLLEDGDVSWSLKQII